MSSPRSTPAGEAILAAASDLFYRRGITATGVDLVCDTAGTTKRTLYQRFGSKDGLIAAYLRARAHEWQTHLLGRMAKVPDIALPSGEAVGVVFDAAQTWSGLDGRGCAFVNAWAEVGPSGGEAAQVVREEKAWMRALFTRLTGSTATGDLTFVLYEGAQVCGATTGDDAPWHRARAAAVELATPGAGASRLTG